MGLDVFSMIPMKVALSVVTWMSGFSTLPSLSERTWPASTSMMKDVSRSGKVNCMVFVNFAKRGLRASSSNRDSICFRASKTSSRVAIVISLYKSSCGKTVQAISCQPSAISSHIPAPQMILERLMLAAQMWGYCCSSTSGFLMCRGLSPRRKRTMSSATDLDWFLIPSTVTPAM